MLNKTEKSKGKSSFVVASFLGDAKSRVLADVKKGLLTRQYLTVTRSARNQFSACINLSSSEISIEPHKVYLSRKTAVYS